MIKFKKVPKVKSILEEEIDNLVIEMNQWSPSSDEYSTMSSNLKKLYEAKSLIKERERFISPDTLAVVAGNLLGIAMILHHEKINIVASKALGFVVKGRV